LSTIPSPENGPGGNLFGREKRAEQAMNYPFQRILQNKPPHGKDRQRYALYLTVFLVSAGGHFKKDRQKYRQPPAIRSVNLLDALLIRSVSISYEIRLQN